MEVELKIVSQKFTSDRQNIKLGIDEALFNKLRSKDIFWSGSFSYHHPLNISEPTVDKSGR